MTSILHRKEKIVFRAIDVINESGVQSLSTKRIAQMEKIAESTIFKHFPSKTDILLAVIDFYSQYDDDIIETILLNGKKGLDALKFYLDSYLRYYENYPAITAITQGLDEMRYMEALSQKVKDVINKRHDSLVKIFTGAQMNNEISKDFEAGAFADAVMGTLNGIIRRWRMEAQTFDLYARCYEAIALIIHKRDFYERGDKGE